MNTTAYTAMAAEMEKGTYTEISAKKVINNLYIQQSLTEDEYTELMEKAGKLKASDAEGTVNARLSALENEVSSLKEAVSALQSSSDVPPATEAKGTSDDPILAYRGADYKKDLYYKDPEDKQIYVCTKDVSGWDGIPHEAVNIYFNFYSVR